MHEGLTQMNEDTLISVVVAGIALLAIVFLAGARVVRPTNSGLVEQLGKYRRLGLPGFNWIIPIVDRLFRINITEKMVNAEPQEIITNDKLNARVDAQVYFKVKSDEESIKNSQYNVFQYEYQIVNLARTTLRNIIGDITRILPLHRTTLTAPRTQRATPVGTELLPRFGSTTPEIGS